MQTHNENLVKTKNEINLMGEGGRILADILGILEKMIEPGVSAWSLEERFLSECRKNNVIPSCLNFNPYGVFPFPTGLCVSVNNQSVHCFPVKEKVFNSGDIVTVDTIIKHGGLNVDSAFAKCVGKPFGKRELLLSTSKAALDESIKKVKSGERVGTISSTMQKVVEDAGFNVIREYAGHGIGVEMHEPPEIPCFGKPSSGTILREGMTICIEALVCSGKPDIKHRTVWETEMRDGGDFCQFEHTVLVTKNGFEVLTKI